MYKLKKIFVNYTGKIVGYNEYGFKQYQNSFNMLKNYDTGVGKGTDIRNLTLAIAPYLDFTVKTKAKFESYQEFSVTTLSGGKTKTLDGAHIVSECYNLESPKISSLSYIGILLTQPATNALIDVEEAILMYTFPDLKEKIGKLKRISINGTYQDLSDFQQDLHEKMKSGTPFEKTILTQLDLYKNKFSSVLHESHKNKTLAVVKEDSPFFLAEEKAYDNLIILSMIMSEADKVVKRVSIKQLKNTIVSSFDKANNFAHTQEALNNIVQGINLIKEVRDTDIFVYKQILSHKPSFDTIDIDKLQKDYMLEKEAVLKYNSIVERGKELANGKINSIQELQINPLLTKIQNLNSEKDDLVLDGKAKDKYISNFPTLSDTESNYTSSDLNTIIFKLREKNEINNTNLETKKNDSLDIENSIKNKQNEIKKLKRDKERYEKNIEEYQKNKKSFQEQLESNKNNKETYSNTQNEDFKFSYFFSKKFHIENILIDSSFTKDIDSIKGTLQKKINNLNDLIEFEWNSRSLNLTEEQLMNFIEEKNTEIEELKKDIENIDIAIQDKEKELKTFENPEELSSSILALKTEIGVLTAEIKYHEKLIKLFEEDEEKLTLKAKYNLVVDSKKKLKDLIDTLSATIEEQEDKKKLLYKSKESYEDILKKNLMEESVYYQDISNSNAKYSSYTIDNIEELEDDIKKYREDIYEKKEVILNVARNITTVIFNNETFSKKYNLIDMQMKQLHNQISSLILYETINTFLFEVKNLDTTSEEKKRTIVSNLTDANSFSLLWPIKEKIDKRASLEIRKANEKFQKDKTNMGFFYVMTDIENLNISELDSLEAAFNDFEVPFDLFDSNNIISKEKEIIDFIESLFDKGEVDQSLLNRFQDAISVLNETLFLDIHVFEHKIGQALSSQISISLIEKVGGSIRQPSSGNQLTAEILAKKKLIKREMESGHVNFEVPFVMDEASKSKYVKDMLKDGTNIVLQQDVINNELRKKCKTYISDQNLREEEIKYYNQELIDDTLNKTTDRGLWKILEEHDSIFDGDK